MSHLKQLTNFVSLINQDNGAQIYIQHRFGKAAPAQDSI